MMQHTYRNRGGSSANRGLFGWMLAFLGVGFSLWLVYWAIGWFRTSNEIRQETISADETVETISAVVTSFESSAVIIQDNGSTAGMVYRRGTIENPSFNIAVTLPALTGEDSYGIWMVKDGLADVKFAGTLTGRADGSFVHTFAIKDPQYYPNLVIMAEPNDGLDTPSGNIVAQGRFE